MLVRRRGRAWLERKGLLELDRIPPGTKIKPFWGKCRDDLHRAYRGVCAYLCVYFECNLGAATVDHFVPKSRSAPRLIYEWSNYRLACSKMNARKREHDDVLDPFCLPRGTFRLELVTGRIFPSPRLSKQDERKVEQTIARLELDSPSCRDMRARHYQDYCEGCFDSDHLRRQSPFVWAEARRQRLL